MEGAISISVTGSLGRIFQGCEAVHEERSCHIESQAKDRIPREVGRPPLLVFFLLYRHL